MKILAKSNCIFFISVPNGTKIFKMKKTLKIEKGPIQPLEHLNCFTRYSLIKLFNKYGYRKISLFEILHFNFKNFKFERLPISEGIEPVNPQNSHDKVSKLIKSPISGGIAPRFKVPVTGLPVRVIFVVSEIS